MLYQWDKSNAEYQEVRTTTNETTAIFSDFNYINVWYSANNTYSFNADTGIFSLTGYTSNIGMSNDRRSFDLPYRYMIVNNISSNTMYATPEGTMFHLQFMLRTDGSQLTIEGYDGDRYGDNYYILTSKIGKGSFVDNVYSIDQSAYPTNGQLGNYWYDNRTQINTPSQPGNLVVPQMVPNSTVQVTWGASTATVGNVVSYTLERSVDGNAWTSVYTGTDLSYTDTTGDWATVAYRVYATDNYGSTSDINTSETQTVQDGLIYVTFTTPEGEKTAPFTLEFQLGVSGETTSVSDINCVGYLDGKEIYNSTLATGTTAQIPIDTTELGSGTHNINISAYKEQLIGANQFWSFSIAAIPFPEGGYGLQLQDYEGNDLLPITLSSLVKGINGKTVAENLQEMAASAGLSLIEGSYTGTGAYGSATPNTLALTIEPQIVFISDSSGIGGLIMPLINGNTQGLSISASGAIISYPLVVSWTGNNVSWYNTSNAAAQLNTSGHVYSYRIIG